MKKIVAVALILMMICGIAFAEEEITTIPELIASFYPEEELQSFGKTSVAEALLGAKLPENSILIIQFNSGKFILEYEDNVGNCYYIVPDNYEGSSITEFTITNLATQNTLYEFGFVDSCWFLLEGDGNIYALYEGADNENGICDNWEDYQTAILLSANIIESALEEEQDIDI